MKKFSILNLINLTSVYSTLFLVGIFILGGAAIAQAQKSSKTFTKELTVESDAVIRVQGPKELRVRGNGRIFKRNGKDGSYLVSKNGSDPIIYSFSQQLQIETWDRQFVKQESEVTLACKTAAQTEELMNALNIELSVDAAGHVNMRYEMNIEVLQIENGWFKEDDNSIVLNNGKEYKITYLQLSTKMYVPKESQLKIVSNSSSISLGNHLGALDLELNRGSFTAGVLNEMVADVENGTLTVGQLKKGKLHSLNAKLNISDAGSLVINSELSSYAIARANSIVARDLVNEKWSMGTIGSLVVEKGIFSEFKLIRLSEALEMRLKNCDLSVQQLDREVQLVLIHNQNAKVDLGVNLLNNYALNCQYANQAQYHLPAKLKEISSDDFETKYAVGDQIAALQIDMRCKLCDVTLR